MSNWYKNTWLVVILLLSFLLAISNLGDRHFWGDEVHLLNLGKSVIKYGLPVVDDVLKHTEVTYEVDDLTGKGYAITETVKVTYNVNIAGKEIYNLHPWLVSYISAIPIAIFGPYSEFFIRLPFVLIGLLAIPLTFSLAFRITKSKRTAMIASVLLAFSTVFLLALRNANYYGLIIFALPATLFSYLRTLDNEKNAWWQFTLAGTMLFHSQWLVFMGTILGIAAHFILFNRNKIALKRVIKPIIGIFILTFPWFILTGQLSKASAISSPLQYFLLLSISAYHFILWFVPLLLLIFVPWLIFSKSKNKIQVNQGYALLALTIIASFLFTSLNYYTGTPIRYYYGLLPLAMIFNAAVIEKLFSNKHKIAIIVVILLVLTNIIQIAPLLPFKPLISSVAGSQDVLGTGQSAQQEFVEKTLRPRMMLEEYIYEITHHVESPTSAIIDEISKAEKTGTDIFVAAGDANAIGYYTGMRPGTYDNNFNTRTYDWIVLPVADTRNSDINLKTYKQVYLNLATERWGDTADPVHHLFSTTEGDGFYLYHRAKQ